MGLCLRDEDGFCSEPCLDCPYHYVEDIWGDDCCDAKQCIHEEEYNYKKGLLNKNEYNFS